MKIIALITTLILSFGIIQNYSSTAKSLIEPPKTIYVNADEGKDSGICGEQTSPYKNIQIAIANAKSGDKIEVAFGNYQGKVEIISEKGNKDNITLSGISNEKGEKPKIVFGDKGAIVSIKGKGINIEGFEITNGEFLNLLENGSGADGISVSSDSQDITIQKNYIHQIGGSYKNGIYGNSHGILVRSDLDFGDGKPIKTIRIVDNNIEDLHLGQSEAITISGNVSDALLQDNVIKNVDNIAIDIVGGWHKCPDNLTCQASGQVIHNEVSYVYADQKEGKRTIADEYCKRPNQFNPGQGVNSHTMAAIYVDGGVNTIIERNKVYCSATGIEFASEMGAKISGITVKNNIVYDNFATGLLIGSSGGRKGKPDTIVSKSSAYNNTFYNNNLEQIPDKDNDFGSLAFGYSNSNLFSYIQIANNILINDKPDRPHLLTNLYSKGGQKKAVFLNNIFFSTSKNLTNTGENYETFAKWEGNKTNSFLKDAEFKFLFFDLTANNYNLAKDSFALDKGDNSFFKDCKDTDKSNSCVDFSGKNPRIANGIIDIGAFEFQK